jgi:hypothetical protein
VRDAWEETRRLYAGEYLGAESWMQIMTRRSNWLCGRAHSPTGMFLQRTGETTTSDTVFWEGTTYYRPEHPMLNFSARMNLAAGGAAGARLQYYAADETWKPIDSDGTTGDAWFNATENSTYDLATLGVEADLPDDGYLRLRFIVDGTGGTTSADVYRAFMSGQVDFTGWAAMADFSDEEVPTADQLNAIRQSQTHLLECAERIHVSEHVSTYQHTQDNAAQTLVRYAFRYDGRNRLYMYLYTAQFDNAAEELHIYLCDEKYPASGSRLNGGTAILSVAGDTGDPINLGGVGYNWNLADYSLTRGNYYQIEVVVKNIEAATSDYPILGIAGAQIADTDSPTRTYVPATFEHGDVLTHAHLNNICDDLEQMYQSTAGAESPIYPEHWISTHQPASHNTITITASRIRLHHTWRWLRYASAGAVPLYVSEESVPGELPGEVFIQPSTLVTLPNTDGEPALYDLSAVGGLPYGIQYYIADSGQNRILWAAEDYSD